MPDVETRVILAVEDSTCWASDLDEFLEKARALDGIPHDFLVALNGNDVKLTASTEFRERGTDD